MLEFLIKTVLHLIENKIEQVKSVDCVRVFEMKAGASKDTNHYRRDQRFMHRKPLPLSTHHRHSSRSHAMSFNGTTLRVFINGAWITWIYLFAIFIRLEHVDAKIGKRFQFKQNINVNVLLLPNFIPIYTNRRIDVDIWSQVHEFKHKHN